jgi:mannobiose 2-epimerase
MRSRLQSVAKLGRRIASKAIREARRGKGHYEYSQRALHNWTGLRGSKRGLRPPDEFLTGAPLLVDGKNWLNKLLIENILPFWFPGSIDQEYGGYHQSLGSPPDSRSTNQKSVIIQARMLWFYSRLAQSEFGEPAHLEAAKSGFKFLTECLYDQEFGGYFWEVSREGRVASVIPSTLREEAVSYKNTLAQAYALYAISEYALASRDPSAYRSADELYQIFAHQLRDAKYGGYLELMTRDWKKPPAKIVTSNSLYAASYKSFRTQVHVLEAFTRYSEVIGEQGVRSDLAGFLEVLLDKLVLKRGYVCGSVFSHSWKLRFGHPDNVQLYGHDLEFIWMVMKAMDIVEEELAPHLECLQGLFATAVNYGFDEEKGGFYFCGPFGRSAADRSKVWWVQAEALLSCLYLYRLTESPIYADCFNRTLNWIVEHQADWAHGEWHSTISATGQISGPKAGPWKAAYHNGRSVIESLRILSELRD